MTHDEYHSLLLSVQDRISDRVGRRVTLEFGLNPEEELCLLISCGPYDRIYKAASLLPFTLNKLERLVSDIQATIEEEEFDS